MLIPSIIQSKKDSNNYVHFFSKMKKSLTLLFSLFNLFCYGQSPQCIPNSTNGSFELPTGCGFCIVDASTVPEWYTTATDNMIEIWPSGFSGVPAYLGIQFVELNANQVSTLYQDICTPCPNVVTWAFAHRGRQGTDVLALKAGPPGGPYTQEGVFSDGNTAWGFYSGTYTVPLGQVVTRFLFESVSAAGGNMSIGNFLDAVNFSFVPIVITVNSATICAGQTVVLTAGGGTAYSWSSGETTNSITVSPTTTASYTVTGTTDGVCYDTAIAIVTVYPMPVITVNSATICAGQTATLTAGGGTTYSWSGGEITNPISISPNVPLSYTVTGTTDGCSDTAIANLTVNPLPVITVNSATICAGETATLIAAGGTTYSWSSAETTNPISVSPNATTSYTTTGTADGCSDSAVSIVTVNPLPVITVNSATICAGQTVILTATGGATYSWSSAETTNSISVLPSSATSYTVTGTSADGCSDTAISIIDLYPIPVISVYSATICAGQITVLTASGGVTYSWSSGETTDSITVSPLATSSYTVTGTTGDGCSDTDVAVVTVFPIPVIPVNSATICSGQTVILTAAGGTTYSWSGGETTDSISVTPAVDDSYTVTGTSNGCSDTAVSVVTVNPMPTVSVNSVELCAGNIGTLTVTGASNYLWNTGATTNFILVSVLTDTAYTVTGTINGCSDTAVSTVIAHSIPNANFSTVNVCDGSLVPFIDLSTISLPDTIQSLTWNFGDGSPIDNNQNTSHLYAVAGSYTVQLLVVSNFGCPDSVTGVITVNPKPVVSFEANDTTGCSPLCITFQNSSVISAGGIASWTWSFGDGSSASDPYHCYTNNSTFLINNFNVSLTVTSDSGCVSSLSKNNYITVYPNPIANFTIDPQTTTLSNPIISFSDLSSGADFWNWNFGNGSDSSVISNPSPFIYPDTGSYIITLITSTLFNCFDTAYQTIIIEPDFVFFIPNSFTPDGDWVNDTFTGKGVFIKDFEMMIFDRWGNLIFFSNNISKPWDGTANHGNEIAQEDVYVYSIKVVDTKGIKHNYKGIVTLVK